MRMRRDESGQHAHGRAGVAAVERMFGLAKGACGSGDFNDIVFFDDSCPKGFHAGERRVWVGAGGEVGEAGGAFGETGEHGVAVGDGLVSGQRDRALQRAGGANGLNGH